MLPPMLAQFAKSPWTYVALFAALASLAGGIIYQAAQPSGVVAVEPTPWPDDVPQRLPRDFHPSEVRQVHPTDASREAARNCPTGNIGAEPGGVWRCLERGGVRPLSESEIQTLWQEKREKEESLRVAGASATPIMGELIELENGKSLQLPDDVYVEYVNDEHGLLVSGGPVPILPERKLVKGESSVWIDGNGNLRLGLSRNVLDEFPFLTEFQDDSHPRKKVELRGQEIKLPDAVYVSYIASARNLTEPAPPSIKLPIYEFRKGQSSPPLIIAVDANGKLLPNIPASLLDEFPFLKEFQDE